MTARRDGDEANVLPARKKGLIVERLDDETVVYDPTTDRMHCLNATAAFVLERCDGATPRVSAARALDATLDASGRAVLVDFAVERLARARLVETPTAGAATMSRREVTRVLGLTGALTALLPVVISVTAPSVASAQTCLPAGGCCKNKSDCCPGLNCQGPVTCVPTGKRCQ